MMERMLKPDLGKKNPWEREFATSTNRGSTGWFQKKGFHSQEFAGQKQFGGVKDYHTKDFSQSSKASSFGTKESNFASKENRMGKESFATKDSRYSSQMASQGNKAYREAGNEFKTGEFQPGRKALKDNKRIVLDPSQVDDVRNADAYSEADVKRLLGR